MSFSRQVTLEEANAKSTELNIMFMETSAKAGHNVKSLFKKIAMSLVGLEKENEVTDQNASMSHFPTPSFLHESAHTMSRNRCHDTPEQ